eukprot:7530407-Pyramimonas_sp.AAC.1
MRGSKANKLLYRRGRRGRVCQTLLGQYSKWQHTKTSQRPQHQALHYPNSRCCQQGLIRRCGIQAR